MTDPRGKVYSYAYDLMNRSTTVTYPADGGNVVRTEARTYDSAGNLATFKNRAGDVQTFQYDTRNRETRYDWDDGVTPARALIYDNASRVKTCNATGVGLLFTYYDDGTPKSQEEWTSAYGDNTHRTVDYTYDADGRRATIQYPSGQQYNFSYTPRGEARAWSEPNNPNFQVYYTYDASGNRSALGLAPGDYGASGGARTGTA